MLGNISFINKNNKSDQQRKIIIFLNHLILEQFWLVESGSLWKLSLSSERSPLQSSSATLNPTLLSPPLNTPQGATPKYSQGQ